MTAAIPEDLPDTGAILPFPDTAERRLRRALHALDQAIADQQAAVAGFRAQLQALHGAVGGMEDSAQGLRHALEEAAADTARAAAASRELGATAELMDAVARR